MEHLLKPDTQIGAYRVLRHIGEGGMGDVYEAVDDKVNRKVALKVFRASDGKFAKEKSMNRFVEEARTLAQINHPNIVSFYSIEDYQGTPCFAMEFVKGISFRYLCDNFVLTPFEALPLMLQILEGVRELHENQILHRDLTPGNLILRADGRVKILDFGIAKSLGSQTDRTQTGVVVGTPQYMAAEVFAGVPATARSDLWSLGAIFYELMTGDRLLSKQGQIRDTAVRFNRECLSWIPHEMQKVLVKLCAHTMEERYGSAQEVIEDLKRVALTTAGRAEVPLAALLRKISNAGVVTTALAGQGLSPAVVKRIMTIATLQQAKVRPVEGAEKTVETDPSGDLTLSKEVVGLTLARFTQSQLRSGATGGYRVHQESHRLPAILFAGALCAFGVVGFVSHWKTAKAAATVKKAVAAANPSAVGAEAAVPAEARTPAAIPAGQLADQKRRDQVKRHQLEAEIHDLELNPKTNPELTILDGKLADMRKDLSILDNKIKSVQTDAREKNEELERSRNAREDQFQTQRKSLTDRLDVLKGQLAAGGPPSARKELWDQVHAVNDEWDRVRAEHESQVVAESKNNPDADATELLRPLNEQRAKLNDDLNKLEAQRAKVQTDQTAIEANRKKRLTELRQQLSALGPQ